ncbi:MAG: hypothetical protein GY853_15520 [PVC group bacterium]|nr:hypothetical protein [PVC group bacterium]
MMNDPFKLEFWDNFNDSLYFDYLMHQTMLKTYRITYKTYKGSDTSAPVSYAIKYVKGYNKQDAKAAFNLWKELIIKIEQCD